MSLDGYKSSESIKSVEKTDSFKGEKKEVNDFKKIPEQSKNNIKINEIVDELDNFNEKDKKDIKLKIQKALKFEDNKTEFLDGILEFVKEGGVDKNILFDVIGLEEKTDELEVKTDEFKKKTDEQEEDNEEQEEDNEEQEEDNEEQEEDNEEQEERNNYLRKLINSVSNLPKDRIYSKTLDKLRVLYSEGNYTNEDLKKILRDFNNPQTLKSIVVDLKKQGGNAFRDFRKSIDYIDKELGEKIDLIDFTDTRAKISLGVGDLDGVDLGENVLRGDMGDGFEVSAGRDGRKLSLQGSEYEMDAGIDNSEEIDDFVEVEKETKEELKPINEKLSSIRAILNFVKKAILKNADLGEVKEKIKNSNSELYNELNIDSANSLGAIESKLAGIYKEKEEEKERILEEKKEILDAIIEFNMQKAIERDEKQKETLKFLHSIGFDLIDQNLSDRLIEMINSSEGLKARFGFDKKIDLANGDMGINLDSSFEDNSIAEQKVFAEFVNKIISGDENHPIEIASMSHGTPVFKNELGEEILDKKAYVNSKMQYGYGSILQNLGLSGENNRK